MTWPVYERYFIWYEDVQGPDGSPERHPHLAAPGPRLSSQEIDFVIERHYAPLQHPELLLRLAELGGLFAQPEKMTKQETHPLAEMRAFASEYGLLGVSDSSGRDESLEEFTVAAGRVSRTLRLYEAASAYGGNGDPVKLQALYRNTAAHGLTGAEPKDVKAYRRMVERAKRDHLRERAFDEVSDTVSEALAARAFPAVYHLRNKDGRTERFERGDGFRDLLGATYLLLSYAMMDPSIKTCKRDGCNRIIDFTVSDTPGNTEDGPKINPKTGEPYERGPYSTRSDKEFCSKACYRNWRYHNIEKPKKRVE